jgi:predicted HicB family RNase H-like nuclease
VTKFVLRLSEHRHAAVKLAAEREGISAADVIRLAVNAWLDDHPPRPSVQQRSEAA